MYTEYTYIHMTFNNVVSVAVSWHATSPGTQTVNDYIIGEINEKSSAWDKKRTHRHDTVRRLFYLQTWSSLYSAVLPAEANALQELWSVPFTYQETLTSIRFCSGHSKCSDGTRHSGQYQITGKNQLFSSYPHQAASSTQSTGFISRLRTSYPQSFRANMMTL